jgi:hypothetical protein
MRKVLKSIFYFLPVQLLLLHARKYQLLLAFWLLLLLTVSGKFASHFGASSLFLAPEYLGNISFSSMFLLGCSMCVFIMMWHITTFIVHSKRMPYMGATRHAFVVYCINNSAVPLAFLVFYSVLSVRFQLYSEHSSLGHTLFLQLGFYLGLLFVALVSFVYFFRVSRDFFKTLFSSIANPARIRGIIPYDSLDYEIDIIQARSYISGDFKIAKSEDLEPYHPRVMNMVLRRHHRNVIFAALVSYVILLLLGAFMDQPLLRIPAGAGFLLLFSIIMGIVGAFKYFTKSWETLGWITFLILISTLVRYRVFDLRSIAYGMNYHGPVEKEPEYNYDHLRDLFTKERFMADKRQEETRLDNWKKNVADSAAPPLVVITVSGGGSRAAYWTFRTLQYLDSASHGKLFKNTVLIAGASGGLIGATYWRSIHDAYLQGKIKNPYEPRFQENIGKDLLNAIVFSLASVDLISPFNKISLGGYSYTRDRGYAMEQEMIRNTDGLLDKNMGYFKQREANGIIPQLIISGTIINDGRKLMMTNQPVAYLTQPEYSLNDPNPPIDAVDFAAFFADQDPYNIRLTSQLRMNATFPFVLPVVRLPSQPRMNIMDAGLRDNFGSETASRYVFSLRNWIQKNAGNVICLEIRDTREFDVSSNSDQSSFSGMITDPFFVIQNKWEAFQSYGHGFLKDYSPFFLGSKLKYVTFQYVPKESKKAVALNFHLSQREKEDLYQSLDNDGNQAAIESMLKLLK